MKVVLSPDLTHAQHAAVRAFCDASPGYSYLQDPDWPDVMQGEGGRHSYRHVLVERDAGGLAAYGVLRLSPVPGGLALGAFRRGPVVAAPADLEPVLRVLLPALRNAGLITVAMNPRWEDAEAETVEQVLARLGGQVAPPARQRLHSCTGLIDLAPVPEEIFAACTAHARRNLRKLDKLGLTLRPVADGAEMVRVRDWTEAFARARDLTTRGLPGLEAQRDWIARHGGALVMVEAEGAPVGAFSLLRDGPRLLNMSNGWADPDARLPRSYLVYWYAIRRWAGNAEPDGPRWLDLAGRDDPRVPRSDAGAEGRERFKDGFPQRHVVLPRMHRFVLRPLLARALDGVERLRAQGQRSKVTAPR